MNRIFTVSLCAAAVLLLGSCASPSVRPSEAAPSVTEEMPEKCLTPTEGAIQKLQDDVAATLGDVTFTGHGVIKSESGEDFWYIALAFDDEGQGRTGTWGTLQDPTTQDDIAYVAVDDMAPLVSTYQQPVDFAGTTSTLIGADDCIL